MQQANTSSNTVYTSTAVIMLRLKNGSIVCHNTVTYWKGCGIAPTRRQCVESGLEKIPNLDYSTISNTIVTLTKASCNKIGEVFVETSFITE